MTTDPHFSKTLLLVPMKGDHQGSEFLDYAPTPHSITRSGDSVYTSTSQSKYYGSSAFFHGSRLTVHSDFKPDLGSHDFTIECWIRPDVLPDGSTNNRFKTLLSRYYTSTNNRSFGFHIRKDSTSDPHDFGIHLSSNGSDWSFHYWPHSMELHTWYHVAVVRYGNNILGFIDGLQLGDAIPYTLAVNFNPSLQVYIGTQQGRYATNMFHGYMQDLRLTVGVARYTDDFTPPGPLLVNKYINGRVKVYGVPAPRPVHLYHRASGLLHSSVTSDAVTGDFQFGPILDAGGGGTGLFTVVAVDDLHNSLAFDRVVPHGTLAGPFKLTASIEGDFEMVVGGS